MTAFEVDVKWPDADPVAEGLGTQSDSRLGHDLKIRSMVAVAGEFLPFVWPMRNFIHHNPLHGLEHLPFEKAIARASDLFHARGYLRRTDYQGLMHEGKIDPDAIDELAGEFLRDRFPDRGFTTDWDQGLDLRRVLFTLMTQMDQPSAGNAYPSTDAILSQLRPFLD